MKTRTGFVSNSSSSSFTCDVCGFTEETYDGGGEYQWYSCVNRHCFCERHMKNVRATEQEMRDALIKNAEEEFSGSVLLDEILKIEGMMFVQLNEAFDEMIAENGEDVPADKCPLCSFREFNNDELLQFMIANQRVTKADVINTIRAVFPGGRKDFIEFIKNTEV